VKIFPKLSNYCRKQQGWGLEVIRNDSRGIQHPTVTNPHPKDLSKSPAVAEVFYFTILFVFIFYNEV
jgi:hypothetical protein